MQNADSAARVASAPQQLCIYELLRARAECNTNALAVLAPGRAPLTYGRLHEHVNDVVQTLHAMGLSRNDRVALVLANGPEMAVAALAVAAGTTCAPLNPAYSTSEFDFYLTDLCVAALIIQVGIDSPARAVAQARGIRIIELSPMDEAEVGLFTLGGEKSVRSAPHGFAQPYDVAVVLPTSGTTSRPKIVPLTHMNVCLSAYNTREALALAESDCCLNVMPLFHPHGLLGAVLTSLMAGARVVCTAGFVAAQFFAWLAEFRPTWYTAVPTIHQAILARVAAHREVVARYPLRFIRSGSASLPSQVLAELEAVFNAPVIEYYGMTEAASQVTSNPLPPRVQKPGSVGVAAGPEVAIMDAAGALLPVEATGEIVIRGPSVMQSYDNNPVANREAFTHGWFRTGDQGYVDADGYLFITGRLKEIINRGGEKIAPREVDEVLMSHPAVAQAVTFAVPDTRLGEDVAAAVVLRPQATVTVSDIRRFVATRLADFKVPRQVLFLEDIPKGPTGKLQRLGLAEQLGLTASGLARAVTPVEFVAPRTPMEEMLAELWGQLLEVKRVGIHDNFFQLGGDSLIATQLVVRVRLAWQIAVPLRTLFEAPTIAELTAAIEDILLQEIEE